MESLRQSLKSQQLSFKYFEQFLERPNDLAMQMNSKWQKLQPISPLASSKVIYVDILIEGPTSSNSANSSFT